MSEAFPSVCELPSGPKGDTKPDNLPAPPSGACRQVLAGRRKTPPTAPKDERLEGDRTELRVCCRRHHGMMVRVQSRRPILKAPTLVRRGGSFIDAAPLILLPSSDSAAGDAAAKLAGAGGVLPPAL